MKKLILNFLLFTGMLFCSSCATTPYLMDRERDALDVFTATGNAGFGGRARIGPFSGGIYYGLGDAGLLGGQLGKFSALASPVISTTTEFTLGSFEELYRKDAPPLNRGKLYESGGALTFSTAESHSGKRSYDNKKICWPYYTQIEVIAGVGGGVRLGFNIGEFLDFILGWGNIDIYDDDIEIIKQKEKKSNKVASPNSDTATAESE